MLPCGHCGAWVCLERENLLGWQDAESEWEAHDRAHFACSACGHPWTEDERHHANRQGQLVHRGQKIDSAGRVTGEAPQVMTLGFRWSAVNNLLDTAGSVGVQEWRARQETDTENPEKALRQWVWCLPYDPPEVSVVPLDPAEVARRSAGQKRGLVPRDTAGVSVGVDTGKRECHWVAIAWRADGSGHVIDYGIQPVDSANLGTHAGLLAALGSLVGYFVWECEGGGRRGADQVWIDSGYHEHTDAVYAFCRTANEAAGLDPASARYRPMKGYGETQRGIAAAATRGHTTTAAAGTPRARPNSSVAIAGTSGRKAATAGRMPGRMRSPMSRKRSKNGSPHCPRCRPSRHPSWALPRTITDLPACGRRKCRRSLIVARSRARRASRPAPGSVRRVRPRPARPVSATTPAATARPASVRSSRDEPRENPRICKEPPEKSPNL